MLLPFGGLRGQWHGSGLIRIRVILMLDALAGVLPEGKNLVFKEAPDLSSIPVYVGWDYQSGGKVLQVLKDTGPASLANTR